MYIHVVGLNNVIYVVHLDLANWGEGLATPGAARI